MFEISVVIVSDHGAGAAPSHEELIDVLVALAGQEGAPPTEFLLVENEALADRLPAGIEQRLPGLRVVRSPAQGSYELKNAGVRAASAPIVVMLDGDCPPAPDWLTRIADAWRRHPDAAAISGHTQYAGSSLRDKSLALLSRGFLDPGREGESEFISNNNSSLRREVYLRHPLPEGLGPFAARLQSEAIRREGGRLYFDPRIRVVHAFEGWDMEADIRRNGGYGTVVTRLHDARMPGAWLVRLGPLAIPAIYAVKTWDCWRAALRCGRHFGLRWWEVPATLALAPVLMTMEIPGMWAAYRRQSALPTEYR